MRKRTLTALAILALIYVAGISPAVDAQKKPNIIFILVDDMGWSDVGCYGGEINTPNIDGLAKEGIRFTQCYNTAKCFPSRATLLTGVYGLNIVCQWSRQRNEPRVVHFGRSDDVATKP